MLHPKVQLTQLLMSQACYGTLHEKEAGKAS